jgi:hypothetical protein
MFQVSEGHFLKVLINRFHRPDAVEINRTFTDFWRPRMPVFLPKWIDGPISERAGTRRLGGSDYGVFALVSLPERGGGSTRFARIALLRCIHAFIRRAKVCSPGCW